MDSAKYPERNGDGIARKIEGGGLRLDLRAR